MGRAPGEYLEQGLRGQTGRSPDPAGSRASSVALEPVPGEQKLPAGILGMWAAWKVNSRLLVVGTNCGNDKGKTTCGTK